MNKYDLTNFPSHDHNLSNLSLFRFRTFPRIDNGQRTNERIFHDDKAFYFHTWSRIGGSIVLSVIRMHGEGRAVFRPLIAADKESPSVKYSCDLARVKITRSLSW